VSVTVSNVSKYGSRPILAKAIRESHGHIIYMGRRMVGLAGHPYANPFKIGVKIENGEKLNRYGAILRYRELMLANPEFLTWARSLRELGDVELVCWCFPEACHCDLPAKIANSLFPPRLCVCGCWGFDHEELWEDGEFKGTRCQGGHGEHEFQAIVPDAAEVVIT
jgi:hypothetical protein